MGIYYQCKYRTAWWDPFNWFGTLNWSCRYVQHD